jgi:hypothetical protein
MLMPLTAAAVDRFDRGSPNRTSTPNREATACRAATALPGYDRRFTGDWAKDNERRAAAQQAEGQRHADYLARMTKEQEDRQIAEARESFLAQQQRLSVNRPLES